ncbi:MAG: uracil-DNA glycosylase [Thermohalobaculum sp.]|nr:uracil-DNA glycosylase [Thermohalobaculum sp.]
MLDHHMMRALLEWQVELGATEAIGDAPINRYAPAPQARQTPQTPQAAPAPAAALAMVSAPDDPVEAARAAARAAPDLPALHAAITDYAHCPLRQGARNTVFADGVPGARLMIVGEAPGRDEDLQGKPFVGRAGQLLDRMFAAIGLSRQGGGAGALYITNIVPWRPPQNRTPTAEEIAMLLPFAQRHVELAQPDILVLMGNVACQGLLGRQGITRLRGRWTEVLGRPALPMFHPAFLLRKPENKRAAWEDLLSLKDRLG